jgi:7-cyano-7-deazaguanine synthase in queuosine biosynthesis
MNTFVIECGASKQSNESELALNLYGPFKNVDLRIDYITRKMLGNLPDVLVDLLEVASYVFYADQRLKRVSDILPEYGASWRRRLKFTIPVRCLDVWRSADVRSALASTLGFLSDDMYEFTFTQSDSRGYNNTLYFNDLIDQNLENDKVVLFSGGIDSFAGVVWDLVQNGKSLTLVSHSSSVKARSVQERLVTAINDQGYRNKISYIPVIVGTKGEDPIENTQRSRSFLFACLGLVVARMSGKSSFTFYENGVVSINLPLGGDVIGGRATRTTHPRVIRGLESFFSLLVGDQIEIETPLQWLTKAEVTTLIADAGFSDSLRDTVSCTRTHVWGNDQWHCGVCSQCIDRRFGILGANLSNLDPAEGYQHQLFLDPRQDGTDGRMALGYVTLFKSISGMTKQQFMAAFPEVFSALGYFRDMTRAEAGEKLFGLFQRHANSIEDVIAQETARHRGELFRNELSATCLLAACYSRSVVEMAPPSNYDVEAKVFMDRLSPPVLEFAIDRKNDVIRFRGGVSLSGKEYEFVMALVPNFQRAKEEATEVAYVYAADLADNLGVIEQSMRQQVTRVRESLEPLKVAMVIPMATDSFIENKPRQGYRINPKCKQIALGDLGE